MLAALVGDLVILRPAITYFLRMQNVLLPAWRPRREQLGDVDGDHHDFE